MAGPEGGTKAVVAALLANTGIAVAKFIGFALTRSSSMLAEAVHSVADAGNQALLLVGGRSAKRAATPEHPFGFGRDRFFWSFFVAVVLFTLGGAFAMYEGIHKLRDPHEVDSPGIAVGILLVAILFEVASFRTAIVEANKIRGDVAWWQFLRRTKSAELAVVLLEDAGALFGLVLALIGVTLSIVTDDPVFDALGTIAIGVLLGVIAVTLGIEMRSLLIGESASQAHVATITSVLNGTHGFDRVLHMRTQHLGPDELLVAAKVAVSPDVDFGDVAAAINGAEGAIRAAVPAARLIYIEPDLDAVTATR